MDRVKEYIQSKIDRVKGVPSFVAKSVKYTAIEGKSEILGMFWGKSIKIANVLINVIIIIIINR